MFHTSDCLSRFRNESRTLCEKIDTEFVNFTCRWITDGEHWKISEWRTSDTDVKAFTSMGILLPCHAALVSVPREKFCAREISSRHAREQRLLQYRVARAHVECARRWRKTYHWYGHCSKSANHLKSRSDYTWPLWCIVYDVYLVI